MKLNEIQNRNRRLLSKNSKKEEKISLLFDGFTILTMYGDEFDPYSYLYEVSFDLISQTNFKHTRKVKVTNVSRQFVREFSDLFNAGNFIEAQYYITKNIDSCGARLISSTDEMQTEPRFEINNDSWWDYE